MEGIPGMTNRIDEFVLIFKGPDGSHGEHNHTSVVKTMIHSKGCWNLTCALSVHLNMKSLWNICVVLPHNFHWWGGGSLHISFIQLDLCAAHFLNCVLCEIIFCGRTLSSEKVCVCKIEVLWGMVYASSSRLVSILWSVCRTSQARLDCTRMGGWV